MNPERFLPHDEFQALKRAAAVRHVSIRIDRAAREAGKPHIQIRSDAGSTAMLLHVAPNAEAAMVWLQGRAK